MVTIYFLSSSELSYLLYILYLNILIHIFFYSSFFTQEVWSPDLSFSWFFYVTGPRGPPLQVLRLLSIVPTEDEPQFFYPSLLPNNPNRQTLRHWKTLKSIHLINPKVYYHSSNHFYSPPPSSKTQYILFSGPKPRSDRTYRSYLRLSICKVRLTGNHIIK